MAKQLTLDSKTFIELNKQMNKKKNKKVYLKPSLVCEEKGEVKIFSQPLSVNQCWQGRRFKTDLYRSYCNVMSDALPKIKIPAPPYKIYFEFGMSSLLSDWDNPVKPFQDILQKKYKFNDRDIYEANVKKVKVEKGDEYIKFKIESINN